MRQSRRGTSLIEFTLVGIPLIFLSLSVFQVSLAMWQFHTLSNSVEMAGRYAVLHGRGCTQNGNTCSIKVKDVAQMIAKQALGLDSNQMNVSLVTNSSSVQCAPLSSCFTNMAQFPSTADNGVNLDITVNATYPVRNPLLMFWPASSAVRGGTFTLGAATTQQIQF